MTSAGYADWEASVVPDTILGDTGSMDRRETIAFQLDHSESKVVIVDREFSTVMGDALSRTGLKPLVVDFDDPAVLGRFSRIALINRLRGRGT